MMDLRDELAAARTTIAAAEAALDDEHEGNLRAALERLERLAVGMADLVRTW